MAGLRIAAVAPAISLTAATAKTVIMVTAPTNQRVQVDHISISGRGIVATDQPILYRIYRATTAGTSTATTPVKLDSTDDETIQSTWGRNHSAEPTVGDVLYQGDVHPQGGVILNHLAYNPIDVPGGTRLAIELTAAQAQVVDVTVTASE